MKSPSENSCAAADDLPWLVNGTLEPLRAQQLRLHLERCEQCRTAFHFEQRIASAMREVSLVEYAPHSGFANLAARIDADTRKAATRRSWTETLSTIIQTVLAQITARRSLMLAVTAQACGIAVLAIMLAGQLGNSGATAAYRTLTTQPATPVASASGPAVRMLFDDQATAAQIRNTLGGIDGRIVAGPSSVGAFTVEIGSAGLARPDPISWLRAQPGVRLVEPVLAAPDAR